MDGEPTTTRPVADPEQVGQAIGRAPEDLRARIPELGLTEYWYPALRDSRVSAGKPMMLKMLGKDLCLFRGKSGKVVALDNACPHRGAMLSSGNCEFRGFVACFYHGFVFDERGECVAALGEGPKSPMPGKVRARVYPTVTLKGMVFIWMGDGEPVDPREDIPDDFFDPDKIVLNWKVEWPGNWRPCFENSFDSHPRYLHRNSLLMRMGPLLPPHFPPARKPIRVGKARLIPSYASVSTTAGRSRDYRDYFPGLDAKWPRHNYRLLWSWMFNLLRKPFKQLPRFSSNEEWEMGQHLPCMVRVNYGSHMFTRWAVPMAVNRTCMYYFHSAHRTTALGRAYERAAFVLYHNWIHNKNFSGQDEPCATEAYYDRPEYLAPTDQQVMQWRKMVLTGRGMDRGK